VCLNHLGDVVIEIIHRHFLDAFAPPLHVLVHFGILPRFEEDIENRNQQCE
jgi:hypothetical protein